MNLKEKAEQLQKLYPDWTVEYCEKYINKIWNTYEAIEIYTDQHETIVVRYEDKWLIETDGVSFDSVYYLKAGLKTIHIDELNHLKNENAELQARIDTLTAMMREEEYYE